MSVRIQKDFLNVRTINGIKNDCFVEGVENRYGPTKSLRAYGETVNAIYIPLAYARSKFNIMAGENAQYSRSSYDFNSTQFPFRTDGGRDQEAVFKKALELFQKYNSALLSLHCGFGKTFLGIRLAHKMGYKCAVLTHRAVLFDQWVESIKKFTTAKIQIVGTDGILDPKADFYIFNIAYVHKQWNKVNKTWSPKKLGNYKNVIGMLIVDEAHIACAEEMSRALLYFNPKVSLALTATPIRKDGMDKALELYFGEYKLTQIIRVAKNPFLVYRLPTGVKPEFTLNTQGGKDWNSVITSLIDNKGRNKLILRLIKKFREFNILVLTKRKSHSKILSDELTKMKISNTVMTGTDKTYDKTARVLISTYSKLGVGFDDSRLNMLIIACSVTEVEQYAGRLRDGVGKKRIIIDLVDNDPNCLNHWTERRKWYLSRNGDVQHYYQVFPEEKPAKMIDSAEKVPSGSPCGTPDGGAEMPKETPKRLAKRIPENI